MSLTVHPHNVIAVMAFLIEFPAVAVARNIVGLELPLARSPNNSSVGRPRAALARKISVPALSVNKQLVARHGRHARCIRLASDEVLGLDDLNLRPQKRLLMSPNQRLSLDLSLLQLRSNNTLNPFLCVLAAGRLSVNQR